MELNSEERINFIEKHLSSTTYCWYYTPYHVEIPHFPNPKYRKSVEYFNLLLEIPKDERVPLKVICS